MAKKEKNIREENYKDTRIEFLEETCRSQLFSLDLLSSLGDLQGDKKHNRNPQAILEHAYNYINRLIAFEALAFYRVQESDSDFLLAFCKPASKRKSIQKEVNHAIKKGTFAWALNQNQPVVVDTLSSKRKLIIHALTTKSRIRGTFAGICSHKSQTLNKQILQSLSIAIHYTASALEGADLYNLLENHNQNLEESIQKRTSELTRKTNLLKQENLMRKQAEKDLREKEEWLRSVVENAEDGIITLDHRGIIESFNSSAQRIFGYSVSEAIGRKFSIFILEPDRSKFKLDFNNFVRASRGALSRMEPLEFHGRKKNGSTFPLDLAVSAMSLLNKRRYIVLVRDITKRKETENALRNHTAELKRSNMELENYAYLTTHDLQEPLRKIIIFGDRLNNSLGDTITEREREYLSRMQKAASRMQKFIDDLLQYSRIQAGTKTLGLIDLNRIIDEVVADLNIMITKYQGTVEVIHLPTLEAEPVQMHQLFLNLITNALKYHKKGVSPLIKVSSSYNKKIKIWEIRVEDNGIGIDEKHSRRVFRLFERLHGKSDYEGTGIGLGICQKVVHLHHGEITFESKLGQGATFIITLPEKQPRLQNLSQI